MTTAQVDSFVRIVAQNNSASSLRNLFSFGDSQLEREALFTAARYLARTRHSVLDVSAYCKSVKLMESPNTQTLKRQLALVQLNLDSLIAQESNIDLVITLNPPHDRS